MERNPVRTRSETGRPPSSLAEPPNRKPSTRPVAGSNLRVTSSPVSSTSKLRTKGASAGLVAKDSTTHAVHGSEVMEELIAITLRIGAAFEAIGADYFLGGSLR